MFIIGTPHTKNAGWLWSDNTASGGKKVEADVQSCTHCQCVILMQEWRKVENGAMNGGFCMRCNAPICGPCQTLALTKGCTPFIEFVERETDARIKLSQFMKLAGLEPPEPPRDLIVSGT